MASLMSFCLASCGPLSPELPPAAAAAAAPGAGAGAGAGAGGGALCGEGRGLVSLGRCQG